MSVLVLNKVDDEALDDALAHGAECIAVLYSSNPDPASMRGPRLHSMLIELATWRLLMEDGDYESLEDFASGSFVALRLVGPSPDTMTRQVLRPREALRLAPAAFDSVGKANGQECAEDAEGATAGG